MVRRVAEGSSPSEPSELAEPSGSTAPPEPTAEPSGSAAPAKPSVGAARSPAVVPDEGLARPPAASIRRLRFSWPGARFGLHVESFEVGPGEKVFLSGPSGCGKSTLLSLLAGVTSPSSGEVVLDGVPLGGLGGPARDRLRGDKIGFIFQQFNLVPYLSVWDNVLLPCRFSPFRRRRAAEAFGSERLAAESLLTRLDLAPDLWRRRASKLSTGQQQRAAAARALMGRPPLLLADEPTSALDEDRRLAFLRLLTTECRQAGSSLLFVSHDRRLASEFDRSADFGQFGGPS
ncbi:MAG: ATP-binding cassette domain-containing protein [Deltaproteobacteria bacterium]|jgi:putative ABC transport system ATP-binding protein|nr:ATP-binding cassette domain-containing protein [Deltaproteobacteria bacterium]